MIKLYHAPMTRSARIYWLLEELGIPYELVARTFSPPATPFSQPVPFGKFPAIEDGDVAMFESGAILEYVLERYGQGRLMPAPGAPRRGKFLQWVHFAEATAFPGLANIAWHTLFKRDADSLPDAMADYRSWAAGAMKVVEDALAGKQYLLGSELSGADIMMGFTVQAALWLGVLNEQYPNVNAYLARLQARPAFQKAFAA